MDRYFTHIVLLLLAIVCGLSRDSAAQQAAPPTVNVVFTNPLSSEVYLYILNQSTDPPTPVPQGVLPPGRSITLPCYPTHHWVMAIKGKGKSNPAYITQNGQPDGYPVMYVATNAASQRFTIPDPSLALAQQSGPMPAPPKPGPQQPAEVSVEFHNTLPQEVAVFLVPTPGKIRPPQPGQAASPRPLAASRAPLTPLGKVPASGQLELKLHARDHVIVNFDATLPPSLADHNSYVSFNLSRSPVQKLEVQSPPAAPGGRPAQKTRPAVVPVDPVATLGTWISQDGNTVLLFAQSTSTPGAFTLTNTKTHFTYVMQPAPGSTGKFVATTILDDQGNSQGRAPGGFPNFTLTSTKVASFALTAKVSIEVAHDRSGSTAALAARLPGQGDADYDAWLKTQQPPTLPDYIPNPNNKSNTFNSSPLDVEQTCNRGYNAVYLNCRDLTIPTLTGGTTTSIFKRVSLAGYSCLTDGNYQVPPHLDLMQAVQAQMSGTSTMHSSEIEAMMSWSASASVGGGFGGFTGNLSGGLGNNNSTAASTQKIVVEGKKWFTKYWLTTLKQRIELDPQFKGAVLNLKPGDQASYKAFFETWGTHYPLSTLFGGIATHSEVTDLATVKSSQGSNWNASASAGYSGVFASVNASLSESKSQSSGAGQGNSSTTLSDILHGGSGTDYNSFTQGTDNSLVPLKLILEPIYDLVRPQLFDETDPALVEKINALRTEMESQWKDYLNNNLQMLADPALAVGYMKMYTYTITSAFRPGETVWPHTDGIKLIWTNRINEQQVELPGYSRNDATVYFKDGPGKVTVSLPWFPTYKKVNNKWSAPAPNDYCPMDSSTIQVVNPKPADGLIFGFEFHPKMDPEKPVLDYSNYDSSSGRKQIFGRVGVVRLADWIIEGSVKTLNPTVGGNGINYPDPPRYLQALAARGQSTVPLLVRTGVRGLDPWAGQRHPQGITTAFARP